MLTKAASVTLVVAAGSVLTTAVGLGAVQLVQNSSSSSASKGSSPSQAGASPTPTAELIQTGGATSGGATKGTPPGQTKQSPSPAAEPPAKSLTLSPSPMTATGLAPGISVPRTLTVHNPNNQAVELQSVTATVLNPTPAPVGGLSCTSPADFELVLTAVTPVTIAKNGSQDMPVLFRMNNAPTRNQDACKSKTFSFTFSATATSK